MRVAGIGFRGAAELGSLQDALEAAIAAAGGAPVEALVTEAAKARSYVFRELAYELGIPGLGVSTQELAGMITPSQSERILDKFGTGSLCEAAALAAAGPQARLVAARVVSGDGMATAAIADIKGNTT
ncbi:precorrin methylase [Sulfitobacter sp. SK012]|uniref:cobalamin biosynthesis protein n=1 Tax=Sulfitobacter sp. SK012 TaxID=1389005 RepID=UPI000E0C464D|nr:cobalamin biosynthesis protein [Sulfitobacter sp. SK012]AXI44814.1 precorrin methylase [Sulfitobacter sp. SK012]